MLGWFKMVTSWSILLVAVIYQISLSTAQQTGKLGDIEFGCPSGSVFHHGYCFRKVDVRLVWGDAAKACERTGMYLAWIDDNIENEYVAKTIMNGVNKYWIGLSNTTTSTSRTYDDFVWRQFRSEEWKVVGCENGLWKNLQPDGSMGECVATYKDSVDNHWTFSNCMEKLPFVCKLQAAPMPNDVFFCENGKYINKKWRCDRQNDCGDDSDEVECGNSCSYLINANSAQTGTIRASSLLGSIQSSVGANAVYQDKTTCKWILKAPIGERFKLAISGLALEENADVLRIWTGGISKKESEFLGQVTGTQSGTQNFYSSNNLVILELHTDASVKGSGFTVTWTAGVSSTIWNGMKTYTATSTWQKLSSPEYQDHVPFGLNMEWLINSTSVITLEFLTINLPSTSSLLIYDGEELTSPLVYKPSLSSVPTPAIYISKHTLVRIVLITKTHKYSEYKGFQLQFKQGCSLTLDSALSGIIQSPGYLIDSYPDDVTCEWILKRPAAQSRAVSLRFHEFKLKNQSDFVEIYNDTANTVLTKDLSGQGPVTDVFRSTDGHLKVVFKSNLVLLDKGFSAEYSLDCPVLAVTEWTEISVSGLYTAFNTEVVLSCKSGYSFKQQEYHMMSSVPLLCKPGGMWNVSRIPDCQVSYCGVPPAIDNGILKSASGVTVGHNATYECNGGFTMTASTESGSDTIICKADGEWQSRPKCNAQQCTAQSEPFNGGFNVTMGSGTDYATVIRFLCDPGYELVGSVYVYCQSNGSWSHGVPQCIKTGCPIPSVQNGKITGTTPIKFEDRATLSCDTGYYINGSSLSTVTEQLTCGTDGQFTPMKICVDKDECSQSICPANTKCQDTEGSYICSCLPGYYNPTSTPNGACTDIDECSNDNGGCGCLTSAGDPTCVPICTDSDSNYTCSCGAGYQLYAYPDFNNISLARNENGLRPGDHIRVNHTCVRTLCPTPTPPQNGQMLSKRKLFYYGDTVQFDCNHGYEPSQPGEVINRCSLNGRWQYDVINCTIGTCTTPALTSDMNYVRIHPNPSTVVNFGDAVIIECQYGSIIKNHSLYCGTIGPNSYELLGDSINCSVIDCGPPEEVPGASYMGLMSNTLGSNFTFSCNNGSAKSGQSSTSNDDIVTCQENRQWSFGNLTCTGGRCSDPGTPGGAEQVVKSYEVGQELGYRCTRPGFDPVPSTPLLCEVVPNTNNVQWNSTTLPMCEDVTAPEFENCPGIIYVDKTEAVNYTIPTATDNTGTLKNFSVDPANFKPMTVVSDNINVTYTAEDHSGNQQTCTIVIMIKDRNYPVVNCPTHTPVSKTISTAAGVKVNISEIATVDPDSSNLMYYPNKYISVNSATMDTRQKVTVTASDRWGTQSSCSFLVVANVDTCLRESFPASVPNATVSCTEGNITCTVTCNDGYVYEDGNRTKQYSCSGSNNWMPSNVPEACLGYGSPSYKAKFTVVYASSLPSSGCQSAFDASITAYKTTIAQKLTDACTGIGVNPGTFVINSFKSSILAFTMTAEYTGEFTGVGQDTNRDFCLNYFVNVPVKTQDLLHVTSLNCGSTGLSDLSISGSNPFTVVSKGNSCDDDKTLTTTVVGEKCVTCPPGTYVENRQCKTCPDGQYQDMSGQTTCKMCPANHVPHTDKTRCTALCPMGFKSADGVKLCLPCPKDEYWVNATTCAPCPAGYSTVNITAVQNQSGCKAPCPLGTFSVSGYMPCQDCPLHHYQDSLGQQQCKECAQNQITSATASNSSSFCMTYPSVCNSTTRCSGNGECRIFNHATYCICNTGYKGDSCQDDVNPCDSSPCLNGGVCSKVDSSNYNCTCKADKSCTLKQLSGNIVVPTGQHQPPFPQEDLQKCKTECDNNPACNAVYHTNGYCFLVFIESYTKQSYSQKSDFFEKDCQTTTLFNGTRCEIDLVNSCDANSCGDHGMCQDLVGSHRCLCPIVGEYTGPTCVLDVNLCSPNPCQNGAKCESYGSVRRQCICQPGYTGLNCSVNINDCTMNPNGCSYNGTCKDGVDKYTCNCLPGFSGDHCKNTNDFCQSDGCPNGNCVNDYSTLSSKCYCEHPYELGSNGKCSKVDLCNTTKCFSNGTDKCEDGVCKCVSGYEGSLCQHSVDNCQNNPCENGGTCTDGHNAFSCKCVTGYDGNTCENNINDCPGNCSATNTKKCHDLIDGYKCECNPGWMGGNCTEEIDECASFPCEHGATCTDKMNGYHCNCTEGWTGTNCQNQINYCQTSGCNSGECINLIDGRFCRCSAGTRGDTCDVVPNVCNIVNPCTSVGQCQNKNGTAECSCTNQIYAGDSCELIKDFCGSSSPCGSGGSCSNLPTGNYKCTCNTGYSGTSCETKASRCASLSCHSSAKCLDSEIGCYCPSGRVLTNTGCKGSDSDIEFDLLFDPMIGDEGASSFAVFQQQTPSALSFMFWVKFSNQENANTAVVLEFSFEAPDERSTFLSIGNTSIAFTNESNTENVNFQHQIDDGRWHHVVVSWKSSGMTTVYVDAIRIASEQITVSIKFPKVFDIMIGKKFGGRISQVRLWESSLTNSDMQQLQANYKFNPTGAVLLHGWYQYQLKKGASKVYPTQIRKNDICDVPSCSAKDKIKPKISSCGPDLKEYTNQRVFQNFPAFPAVFDDYTTLYNSTKPDDVYTWGDYNKAVVASDSEGNTASCHVKYYVKFKPDCEAPKTAAQITYCPGTKDICGVGCLANQKLSMATPQKIKCSPLGVYNTLHPRRMFVLPSCGGFTQKTIKVVATMQYDFGVNDCISPTYEDAIRNKIVQTFANTVRLTWTTVCTWSTPSCTNVEVTAKCNAKKIDITLSVSELSNSITRAGSGEVYKAKEVFRVILFQEKVFKADDIAGATLLTSTVVIQEEESCQNGYVIVGDNCVQCGMGSYLNTTMDSCHYCPIGTFAAASGTTQCTSCGAGKTTRSVGSTTSADCVVICQPGQYLDNNACQSCPKHYYQEMTGQDHCLPCPLGKKTSTTGSNSSTLCFDDCPAGTALKSSGQCVECDRGYYRTLNDDVCVACPSEFTTVGNGSKIRDDCKIRKCYAGNFRNASNLCEPCPMGQYQPENLQDMCMHCPQNFTTVATGNDNITDCKFYCRAGFDIMSEVNRTCKSCARGTYKDNSDPFATCASCPSGNTTENMQSTSVQQCSINSCDAGQEIDSQGSCTDCPMNKYQPVDQPNSSNRCSSCPTMTATKQIKTANLTDCLTYCNPGFEFVSEMNRTCKPCSRGTYKDNSDVFANCSACPSGNTTENMQSTSEQQCSINVCEAGQEVKSQGTCSDCPFDKYQPMSMPASTDQCSACPTGKGTKQIKTANLTDCLNMCVMGKQYNATANSCEVCPKGFWNNGNLTMKFEMCEACPVNYTTSGPGMVSVDNCTLLDCAPGYYISGSNCLPCDYGYYQPNRHQTSCIECKVNLNTSSIASATEDSCQIYCGAGLEGQTTCDKCKPGFYKNTAGISKCEECTGNYTSNDARTECDTIFCDKGFKSISNNGNISCDSCPIGKYKDERGNTDCTQCPVGFLTANTASASQTDCSQPNCVPGKFLNASGVCELCHIGTYKSTTGNENCSSCYNNFTTTTTGSTAMSDCSIIVCEAGEKRVASSNTCMKCLVGTYQPKRGQQQCIPCASGNTTGQTGSVMASDCVPFCGQGREYNSTGRSCFPCPLGSYKSTEGNTDNCLLCPTGKTTGSTGSTSSTDCNIDDCLPGTYRDAGGCKNCVKGTYQNLNSQTSCKSCLTGQTTISEAAISFDYCIKDCSAGQQYDYNDNSCKPCPVNYYTNKSVSEFCLKCATGYITLGAGSSGGCIKAPDTGTTTPAPVLDISYKFRLVFRGQIDCATATTVIQNLVKEKIRQRLLQLLILFPDLCRLTNKANCFISISVTVKSNGCSAVGRRKRDIADSRINLEADIPDLSEVATNSQNQASIQSSTLIQQDLNTNKQQYQPEQLSLESSQFLGSTLVCPSGSEKVQGGTTCVPCPAGTYQSSQGCANCSVDTYQDQTGQTSCKTCPGSVKIYTLSAGSQTTSSCVSICAKDPTYCRNGGACMSNTLNVWCSCPERYTGARCTEKAELTSNTAYIIGGSVGGVVAVMFIILIIVGVIRCLKGSRTSSKKSYMGSSKDGFEIDYNRPFPVYDNGYHQSKRGGTMEYSRMNPAFVYDERMEGDTFGRERYPFSDDSSAYRWQEA